MSTAILDCAPIVKARRRTESAARAVNKWREDIARFCEDTDRILRMSVELVESWKAVVKVVDDANRADKISDYMAIGDQILPYVRISNDILQEVDGLANAANTLDCDMNHQTNFQIAVYEMGKISHYFESWPRSGEPHTAQIREEFARGEYRPFREFLNEMQGGVDT